MDLYEGYMRQGGEEDKVERGKNIVEGSGRWCVGLGREAGAHCRSIPEAEISSSQ